MKNNPKIPKGYKQTKIGTLPVEWEVVKLGDLGESVSGLTYSPDDVCEDGILVLRSSNIQDGTLSYLDNVFVDVDNFNSTQENDILICVRNGSTRLIGKNAIIEPESAGTAFGAFMSVYRSKNNRYLIQVFNTDIYRKNVVRNLGATINSINSKDLLKFQIPLPPLPQQQKIAKILATWDDAIRHQSQLINAKKEQKRGLMQRLLTGEVRLPGFEGEWNNMRLGDATTLFSKRNKDLIEARIYSVTNDRGFVYQADQFSREVAGDDLKGYKIIREGEFAYNPARINVGSIAFFEDTIGIISSLYVCFKTNDILLDRYLIYLLSSDKMRHDLSVYGEGGVRVYLWYPLFSKIKISLPPIPEQRAIAKFLTTADREISLLETSLTELREQKRGLMQRLLTGQVRVNVATA